VFYEHIYLVAVLCVAALSLVYAFSGPSLSAWFYIGGSYLQMSKLTKCWVGKSTIKKRIKLYEQY